MDFALSSTTQLAAAIRERRVSATEVLDAHLKRIDERNSALHAIVTVDADAAREAVVRHEDVRAGVSSAAI